jgi:two-component system, cell cycle response regulator
MKADPQKRTILVYNEEESSLQLIIEPLLWEGYNVKGYTSISAFQNSIQFCKPQMIIFDPESLEKDELQSIIQTMQVNDTFVSLITSKNSTTEKITQFLDLGASDFISLPFVPLEFLARVRTQFRIFDMHLMLAESNKKLQDLVEIDDLTGLFNMRSTYQKLDFEIERAKRYTRPVAAVMIDMDKFKSVNDGHDHLFGSYVIAEMGKIIRQVTRTVDIPARYGGDEFLIILSEANEEGVEFFCERLRKQVEKSLFVNGIDSIKLTLSIGYANLDFDQNINSKELVRRADMALYEAKRRGRNRVCGYKKEYDRLFQTEAKEPAQVLKKRKTAA